MMIRTSIAGSVFLMITAATAGCVADHSDSPVLILYNKVPGEDCTITSDDSGVGYARGSIDAQSSTGYLFTPLIKNYGQTTSAVSMEQRLAFLQGADIRLGLDETVFPQDARQAWAGDDLLNFSMGFSAVVDPNGGTTGMAFEIIPAPLLVGMRDYLGPEPTSVQVSIDLFGTMGGGDFHSQTFNYWVDVCNGCTINDLGSCEEVGSVYNTGGLCSPMQDTNVVDCCTSASGRICPAPSTSSPQM